MKNSNKFTEKIFLLTSEFNDSPEDQALLKQAISDLSELGKTFNVHETNKLKIGFWKTHRAYSLIGDLIAIGIGLSALLIALIF